MESETDSETDDKNALSDASGTEYYDTYSMAEVEGDSIADNETETDSRLYGKMMDNLCDSNYKQQLTAVQCRHPYLPVIRIG